MGRRSSLGVIASLSAFVAIGYAGTLLQAGPATNISHSSTATEKAKVVRLAYQDGNQFRKAWLSTYADGPPGRQDVYARYSFDDGASWSAPVLLSRDATGLPTGGQSITTKTAASFVVDNDKPNIFAPPVTSGPRILVTWASAYCPENPGAGHAGGYASGVQGAADLDGDGVADRPFNCMWVATTTDPALASWSVQQLTNGERDAIGDVVAGNATGTAYAMAWQEDPQGLQPGEAEGPGDGGTGATVSGGTNIWYSHASAPDTSTLLANVAQVSDNNSRGVGQPGASRANLQLSGTTAVLAYEETACPGGSGGKCVVYHAFPYASHDANSPGTIISDVTRNSRRVRFVLQGAAAAGASSLRSLVLWRESPTVAPGAPADIVVRRGRVDTAARPGSTGYLPSDVLADAPQRMTDVAASGGNANAHRAILRGDVVVLAYDQTPDMVGADPERTAVPSATYNLYVTRSATGASAGGWSAPTNVSQLALPSVRVVEPRLVPTPATIVNPITGSADPGDTQDVNVLFVSYATESNTLAAASGRVYVSRSIDQGASFEAFTPVSADAAGQSEAQLRASPDGTSVAVLWMGEQTVGDAATKDAMFATITAVQLADLKLSTTDLAFNEDDEAVVTLTLLNEGTADAREVVLSGSIPARLDLREIGGAGDCTVDGRAFLCTFSSIPIGESRAITLRLITGIEGVYLLEAAATTASLETDLADNTAAARLTVSHDGGGCTMSRGDAPVDPALPLLAGVALVGLLLRRLRPRRGED